MDQQQRFIRSTLVRDISDGNIWPNKEEQRSGALKPKSQLGQIYYPPLATTGYLFGIYAGVQFAVFRHHEMPAMIPAVSLCTLSGPMKPQSYSLYLYIGIAHHKQDCTLRSPDAAPYEPPPGDYFDDWSRVSGCWENSLWSVTRGGNLTGFTGATGCCRACGVDPRCPLIGGLLYLHGYVQGFGVLISRGSFAFLIYDLFSDYCIYSYCDAIILRESRWYPICWLGILNSSNDGANKLICVFTTPCDINVVVKVEIKRSTKFKVQKRRRVLFQRYEHKQLLCEILQQSAEAAIGCPDVLLCDQRFSDGIYQLLLIVVVCVRNATTANLYVSNHKKMLFAPRSYITYPKCQMIRSSFNITLLILITSLKHVQKNEFGKSDEHFIITIDLNSYFQSSSSSPFNQIARETYMRNIKNLSCTNAEGVITERERVK
uniref:Uncharacterized protein n=1 Tax=Glossina palpalis gambiensis TaxID=67801 RepID=A0A1B0C5V4_9MUSC